VRAGVGGVERLAMFENWSFADYISFLFFFFFPLRGQAYKLHVRLSALL
jgi:hypothetical protein